MVNIGAADSFVFDDPSHNALIWKRADSQTINANSSSLSYWPPSGQWSTAALSRDSCATQAQSTISYNSSVSLVFVGTSVSVNIIKNTNGAPYNVTLDGEVHQYDSYDTSQQCTADFQQPNLSPKQHIIVVSHNGNASLAASGRSTLYFVSFGYTPSANLQPGNPSSPPVGAIVGGVLAAIAALALGVFIWWFLRRRRKMQAEEEKEEAAPEPYEAVSAFVIPQEPLQDNGRPSMHSRSNLNVQHAPRTKGAEAANNSRYVRNSPWASLTSNNHSRPQVASGSSSDPLDSSRSATESLQPTSVHHSYPPPSDLSSDSSPVPAAVVPLLQHQRSPPRRYTAAPSTVGESVLIDDSDYLPPPSYSPPPSNHPRQSLQQALREKAIYEGTEESGGSSTSWLSPNSMRQALPGGPPTSQSASQTLSQADIDVIARRVADMMRSPASATSESRYSGVSSEAANPQVQQAVRVLLSGQEAAQTQPAPPRTSHSGE